MNRNPGISEKWIKASIIGTMSPSAIIFGPMIAIFSQAMLLEIATRLFGGNIAGFVTGAMLAASWNLFQKIMNFIIFYGFNIVNVYTDLLQYAQKQLHLDIDLVWSPILVLALELSFKSLPMMIATVPEFREIRRSPVSVIYRVISQVEHRLEEIKDTMSRKVFIITGEVGAGKTTQVMKVIENLKRKNIPVSGIYSPRVLEGAMTIGYDVVELETDHREPFLRRTQGGVPGEIGQYDILPQGNEAGLAALARATTNKHQVVIIDEVGKLELNDKGWAEKIPELIETVPVLILVVRDTFADQVLRKWNIPEDKIFPVKEDLHLELTGMIARHMN
jgi:nucleoside-triphosphatase THEP1